MMVAVVVVEREKDGVGRAVAVHDDDEAKI